MKIQVNEQEVSIEEGCTIDQIVQRYKPDADIYIVNGFTVEKNYLVQKEENIVLIKRGEKPSNQELEHLLISRHTPGVHEKIKEAVVGIAGLGGLGSQIAISLARLGIGKLIIADYDVVEPSNLNRQHYFLHHIGMTKVTALKEQIQQINPWVKVEGHEVYLTKENIMEFWDEADILVEALDQPEAKALFVNQGLLTHSDKPIVAASGMAGFESSNTITTKRMMRNLYVVGDGINEARVGRGLMAPRVAIAANHQANMVLRLLVGEVEI